MVEVLSRSKLPLSVRVDSEFHATAEEINVAQKTVSHVMTDADVRGRLSSLKVEPLVRASGVLLETCRQGKGDKPDADVAEAVIEYLDVIEKAFGAVPSVLNNRGFARALLGDRARAHADYEAARRVAPAFIAPRVNELELLRASADHKRLEAAAADILKTDKANRAALRALLEAKMAQRRPNAEILAAASALRESGGASPDDLMLLGSLCVQEGQAENALAAFRELIDKDPTSTEARQRAAAACLQGADYAGAAQFYEDLIKVDAPKSEYYLALALIHDQLDRPDQARRAFDEALQRATDHEREIVGEALREFTQRRDLSPVPEGPVVALAPLPTGPLPTEEEMPEMAKEHEPSGADPLEPLDFSRDSFEPKLIGDVDMVGMAEEEVPLESAEVSAAPPAAAAPPPVEAPAPAETPAPQPEPVSAAPPAEPLAEPPAAEALPLAPFVPTAPVDLAQALGASISEVESGDEIMGAEDTPPIPAPAAPEATRAPPAVEEPPARKILPVVSARPPLLLLPPPPEEPAPPPEVPDEGLEHELEALSAAEAQGAEAATEAEPFRRPTFDVDVFMGDLERKTKDAFDHLYDGMLEARRKDGAEGAAPEAATPGAYASAPPMESLPSVPSAVPPPASPAPAPPMPLLLQEQAQQAARGPAPAPPREPADADLLGRASKLATEGDDRAAQAAVEEYLGAHPQDAHAWNLKGDLVERAADEEQALACYSNAVKYDPALKEAWNNLGVLLHLLGRFEESARALEAGTKVDSGDRHLWHNLGSTYHEMGRLDDAIEAFDHAIVADPKDKVSLNNRGTTLYEKGDFALAREAFERAIAIDPRFEQAHNNLGRAFERLGDQDHALASFGRASELNPRSLTALRNLRRVQVALGRPSEAAQTQSRLKELGA